MKTSQLCAFYLTVTTTRHDTTRHSNNNNDERGRDEDERARWQAHPKRQHKTRDEMIGGRKRKVDGARHKGKIRYDSGGLYVGMEWKGLWLWL